MRRHFSRALLRQRRYNRSPSRCRLRATATGLLHRSQPRGGNFSARFREGLVQLWPRTIAKIGCRGNSSSESRQVAGMSPVRGDGGGAMPRQEAQELDCLSVEPAASLGAEGDKAASSGTAEFGVSAVTLAPGSIACAAWQGVSAGVGLASSCEGGHDCASRASWDPCRMGRPLATTSMRRSSATGTSRFMSASRTLRATLATTLYPILTASARDG